MNKKKQTRLIKFSNWLADTKFAEIIFPDHARKLVFVFLLFTHSLYWLTAWWSPWPFLIFNLIGLWFSQGIFKPWSLVISQASQPEWDAGVLKISVPFVALNVVAVFACLYMFGTVIDENGVPIDGVWKHFYFSAVTLTTLGYGNIVPNDTLTEFVAVVESLVGFIGFAVFAGIVVAISLKRFELK